MMAQTQVVLDQQDFTCPICLDLLDDPIAIPCGHNYCNHCIWEHWEQNTDLETVSCPQCRASFSPMPLLGRNILLTETVEKLRASIWQQAASSVTTAFASTATNVARISAPTVTNVVPQPCSSASVITNLRQPRTSAPVSTNVLQPHRTSASRATTVRWFRILALLFACVAFSVALDASLVRDQLVSGWCIFCWGFCFIGTAVVLLIEHCDLQSRASMSWKDFPITFACYACLLCFSASVLFAFYFVKGFTMHDDPSYNYRMVSLVFSCLATIAYLAEVSISKAQPDTTHRFGYMATTPGLLKVCETFVACFIFVFISNPNSYEKDNSSKWCMAVYCICFILSSLIIILCVGNCTSYLPSNDDCLLPFYALVAPTLYLMATIVWPMCKFAKQHGGSNLRPLECYSGSPSLCPFDKLIVVAVLTGVNFILYLMDLIYIIKQLLT